MEVVRLLQFLPATLTIEVSSGWIIVLLLVLWARRRGNWGR
jgi:hypothetical protein